MMAEAYGKLTGRPGIARHARAGRDQRGPASTSPARIPRR